jgi:tetratricopeptide (TPR) repeat protein
MLIAIALVVGAVGLFLVIGGGGKKKQGEPDPQPLDNQPTRPVKPANSTPQRPPAPRIDNAKKKEGDALIEKMRPLYEEAEALYNEAREIKQQDRKEYQRLLNEANDQLSEIRDLWNQIEEMMPENTEWGADEVADYYYGRAYSKIGKVDELMMAVKKQLTAN